MRLVVISDTHRSQRYIELVRERIRGLKPDLVMHLGDFYDDADFVVQDGVSLIRVPGTWSEFYQNSMIDNRRFEEILGWRFFLTHTPERHYNDLTGDLDPERVLSEGGFDFFLHGHTHHPRIEMVGEVCVVNPGHLYEKDDRGFLPSFGVFEVSETIVDVKIFQLLDGTVFRELLIRR